MFSALAQREGFRAYLQGILPGDRNKMLTALAGSRVDEAYEMLAADELTPSNRVALQRLANGLQGCNSSHRSHMSRQLRPRLRGGGAGFTPSCSC